MKLFARPGISAVLAALTLFGAGGASAAYTTFFDEDLNNSAAVPLSSTPNSDAAQQSFLSKLVTPGVETFESQTVGKRAPLTLQFPGFGGTTLSATLTGTSDPNNPDPTNLVVAVEEGETDGAGRYSVPSESTRNFWQVEAGETGMFTVEFGQPIAAFGFYGIDVGDFGGQLRLQLVNGSGVVVGSLDVPNTIGEEGDTDGSVLFFGLITEDPKEFFSSVRFLTTTGQGDVFAFDNFTIGDVRRAPPIPEPGSLALVALALVASAFARRRY